jgi:hypothetical protein
MSSDCPPCICNGSNTMHCVITVGCSQEAKPNSTSKPSHETTSSSKAGQPQSHLRGKGKDKGKPFVFFFSWLAMGFGLSTPFIVS